MASHLEVRFIVICTAPSNLHMIEHFSRLRRPKFISSRSFSFLHVSSPPSRIQTDHPNVSYGPPITLSWDYLEYDPLDIDEYEIHHPRRRNLRQMGLNYYQRRNLLLLHTDYTEEELRLAWKSVKKAKQQRYITRTYTSAFPVRIVEDACQSAVRKVKRTVSGGGRRSSP